MRTTMEDVAKAAGVSKTTVSHVINSSRKVSLDSYTKVMEAVDRLGYQVNTVARNLRSGQSKMIGFVVSNLSNYFYINVAEGIRSVLKPEGFNLFYVNSDEDPHLEENHIRDFIRHSADGLIIAPTGMSDGNLGTMIPDSLPIVFIDRQPRSLKRDSVLPTNTDGIRSAVEYLIKKGHRRIAFIGSRHNDTMSERFDGYRKALDRAGIEYDESLVHIGDVEPAPMHDLLHGSLYSIMDSFLESARPTAIMIGNGIASVGICNYLKDRKIRIPEEIAVITYDDMFWHSMSSPTISSVIQNPTKIGIEAGNMLLKRLNGDSSDFRTIRIPTSFIEREST
jgi:LacI family transcriptional regulator